ncbi:hypothetical protein D3C81_2162060 [compost metagenome]
MVILPSVEIISVPAFGKNAPGTVREAVTDCTSLSFASVFLIASKLLLTFSSKL